MEDTMTMMTTMPRISQIDGGNVATHSWDGTVYRAFCDSGMPDLFPPSPEHGIETWSDHAGVAYDVRRMPYAGCAGQVSLAITPRGSASPRP